MNKIEIGKRYITYNCHIPENNGKIVTVLGYAGTAKELGCTEMHERQDHWCIDSYVYYTSGDIKNHINGCRLKPIDEDSNTIVSWESVKDIWQPSDLIKEEV